jgi:signal transduction histidine kinase/signal transduction protein with GAF and PtsI domain
MGLRIDTARLKPGMEGIARNLAHWIEATYHEKGRHLFLALGLRLGFLCDILWRIYSWRLVSSLSRGWLWAAIGAFGTYLLVLTVLAWRKPEVFASTRSKQAQIGFDIFFFTLFYFINGDPESNLVLALVLPLLIAARFFSTTAAIIVFSFVMLAVVGATLGMILIIPLPPMRSTPVRLLFVRAVLFACITWPLIRSEHLKRLINDQAREYRRRIDLLVRQVHLAQRLDIESLIQTATEGARSELHCEVVSLFLYQDGRFRRHKSAGIEDDWFAEEEYRPGEGMTGQVGVGGAESGFGSPILDNQVEHNGLVIQEHLAKYRPKLHSQATAHLVAVPLNGANRTFGVLRAVNKLNIKGDIDRRGFTQDDQDMLSTIAALVALAYGSARREQKMQAVFNVNETLTRSSDERQVCEKIAEVIVNVGYSACRVLLREAEDRLRTRALCGLAEEDDQALQAMLENQRAQREVLCGGRLNTTPSLPYHGWGGERQLCSVLRLPLFQQEQVIGILEIFTATDHHFYADEIDTLEVFAAQATMALLNARLSQQNQDQIAKLEELWEQNQDQITKLKELSDIVSSIITLDDHDKLFHHIAHRTAALLRAEDCSIFWVNHEDNTIDLKASHSIPSYLFKLRHAPLGDGPNVGLPAYVAATGQPLCFTGAAYKAHPAWNGTFLEHLAFLPSKDCSSLLIYPIISQRSGVAGVIKVENKLGLGGHAGFTEADQELLDLLATQIVIAVDKIEQIRKLRHLNRVARTITDMDLGEQRDVLGRIAASACAVIPADLAVICPYDSEQEELLVDLAATAGQRTDARLSNKPRESGLTHDVLRARDGYILVEDLDQEPEKSNEFVGREQVRSFIAVSLRVRGNPVGILYCDFRRPRHFSHEEIRNAQAFGELAAIAINNANLFARVNRTMQELSAVQQLTRAALAKDDLTLDSVLNVVLDTINQILGCKICTVSLVNEAEQTIETLKARGVSPEWVSWATHRLNSSDIQAWIVQSGETKVIAGWDERFDRKMFERFHHERLIRIFTPIWGRERVIGTIEVGYDRRQKPDISEQEVAALKRYVEQVALVIESTRLLEQERLHTVQLETLHQLSQQMDQALSDPNISNILRLAANIAAMVSGPGAAASIHTYDESGSLKLHAWSDGGGKNLEGHAPFATAEYLRFVEQAESCVHSGQRSADAIRPCACVPMQTGGKTLGKLCVVYNRDHWFTSNELKSLDLCARQTAIAISIARAHQRLNARVDGLADEIVRSYHTWIGQSLTSASDTLENLLNPQILGPLTPLQTDRLCMAVLDLRTLKHQLKRLLMIRRIEDDCLDLMKTLTEPRSLIEAACGRVHDRLAEQKIELTCEIACSSTLAVDQDRITEVLVDILSNAIKFTPSGGQIQIWCRDTDSEVIIGIRDTGRGIAPEHLEKVFEKYFQAQPLLGNEQEGAGLGLYLARKVVCLHGGTLKAESQLGQGSTFILNLPKDVSPASVVL